MPVSVLIAEDHALTGLGTRAAVDAMFGFEVVESVANGIEAIAAIKRHKPDCAVLDLVMPGASGLEVLIEARRWSPQTRMVVITGSPSAAVFRQLVDNGVDGIFLKSAPIEELCQGLSEVVAGRRVIARGASVILARSDAGSGLSRREIEVLQSIARGLSNSGIADRLGISPKTVDRHRTNLMRKLKVHSTATLLVRAMRDGLIDV
ncbi:response regulator transcription factor [Mesorhizobium sp. Z1-4]|uniref:LuxR C-terminal-related transcriptional regulator n=1 Tax=Mesorhizobium sp. Z1-4 TaxID=2448478 RepID=UPI0013DFAEE6|nr:response regulator transcription factor [Mesorhizobium sp. Z1-4]